MKTQELKEVFVKAVKSQVKKGVKLIPQVTITLDNKCACAIGCVLLEMGFHFPQEKSSDHNTSYFRSRDKALKKLGDQYECDDIQMIGFGFDRFILNGKQTNPDERIQLGIDIAKEVKHLYIYEEYKPSVYNSYS